MKTQGVAAGTLLAAVVASGCDASFRHKVLTTFFDGVPPLRPAGQAAGVRRPAGAPQAGLSEAYRAHGPYAARLCDTCHVTGSGNAVAAANGELCLQCHDMGTGKRFVHGPVASGGGCLVCHDPHGSRYPNLLVSESDAFCYYCHDREAVARNAAHRAGEQRCTACHDAHMSDRPHLLR